MAQYTITPRTATGEVYQGLGDANFNCTDTNYQIVSGINFTPALPSISAGLDATLTVRASSTNSTPPYSNRFFYVSVSFDGGTTWTADQQLSPQSGTTTTTNLTFNGTNTDTSSHVPQIRCKLQNTSQSTGTIILTDSNNPLKIVHSWSFTAVTDSSRWAYVTKLYLFCNGATSNIEGCVGVNNVSKSFDLGYIVRGFTFTNNSSNVFWDYDGYDIGVAP